MTENPYVGWRAMVLGLAPADAGLKPTESLPHVFGVVMDTSYDSGTATQVALSDGTTSMYTSSGGGVIGAGARPNVAAASKALLLVAERERENFPLTTEDPIPTPGRVRITLLTFDGRRAAEAVADDFGYRRVPGSDVFHAMHAVITELRLIDEQQQ